VERPAITGALVSKASSVMFMRVSVKGCKGV
jgi:hypothetical protein